MLAAHPMHGSQGVLCIGLVAVGEVEIITGFINFRGGLISVRRQRSN